MNQAIRRSLIGRSHYNDAGQDRLALIWSRLGMNEIVRAILFMLWLVVVSFACADYVNDSRPVFGSLILPLAFLPFIPRQRLVEPIPRRDIWVICAVLAVFIAAIAWSIISGFNKASGDWFESSDFRPVFAIGLWLLLITAGIYLFRAKRFLR